MAIQSNQVAGKGAAKGLAAPPCPVVALGASAGGLEAYEAFFRAWPAGGAAAFVLISHLDPTHVSLLTEIVQRVTALPVVEVTQALPVQPGHVYVIPPNRALTIAQGVLQLTLPKKPRGHRTPIDAFFATLASDLGERAVGIVLSGSGSDGTLGLRAIRAAGGLTLVQEPTTAKYDSMPLSAIAAQCAMQVLSIEAMVPVLQAHLKALPQRLLPPPLPPPSLLPADGIERLLSLLKSMTGHDFRLYKQSTIARRIERRMGRHNLTDLDVYARFLQENPSEANALLREMLINVTSFFRDPEVFVALKQEVLPLLFADKPDDYVFRVWVAGCATGEEAYSIAMVLREWMEESHTHRRTQIYATDLDDGAIATARAGVYPTTIVADVTPERLQRFFFKQDGALRIHKDIREMIVFAVQDVIKDPPFTKLDLLSCRNLLIYLETSMQNRLLTVFHYTLRPGGVLLLSPSESIGKHSHLFAPQNRKSKFYRAIHGIPNIGSAREASPAWAPDLTPRVVDNSVKKDKLLNFSDMTKRLLLQSYAPASVVADVHGNLLFVYGETGRYLRPAPGAASLQLVEMARDGLQLALKTAIRRVADQDQPTLA